MDKTIIHKDKSARLYGITGTVLIHGILLIILLWLVLHTPIPPYPEGGGGPGMGIEVNLGNSSEGMDIIQPKEVVVPDYKETQSKQTSASEEKLLTDNSEESEPINNSEKPEKKYHKKAKTNKIVPSEAKTEDKNSKSVINAKALYTGKTKTGGSQGITGKPGDQGNPDGLTGSVKYTGQGKGTGNGTGGGVGNGTGNGIGDGISFSLEGRNFVSLPKPDYNYQVDGTVVVEITVDQNGNVINAIPGVKGSNTLDDYLLQAAKKAALKAKFDKKADSPIQKGQIKYHFVLQ
jgi:TonB family protein